VVIWAVQANALHWHSERNLHKFSVRAPTTPGTYTFYIRPLIEGAQWMEDYGIYWQITVPQPR
jgi:hypothetical protein